MKNKADMRTLWKEAGILFAITLIAGILLGFVYELTEEPRRVQQELAVQRACQEVFAEADSFEPLQFVPSVATQDELAAVGVKTGVVYEAMRGGSMAGYVIESTSSEGYGGNITIYAGVTADGVLNGISILEIDETPGLGMNAEKVLVPQFAGKEAGEFTYTKTESRSENEIEAISGATRTTAAVTNAVNGALRVAGELLTGGDGDE